jgi:hypothetical protein
MSALLSALALFLFAWVLHVAWWRIRLPQHQMGALLGVFALAPAAAAVLWLALGRVFPVSFHDIPGIALFYFGGLGCYLIAYTGVEETSPSLAAMQALQDAAPSGCSPEELSTVITDENFVKPRIDALKRDGMLVSVAGGYVLTERGRQAARLSLLLSRLFNIRSHA